MTTVKQKEAIHFDYLYEIFKNDQVKSKKLLELFQKWKDEKLTIGFTGHFSAGKSTMINSIINDDLLPSSPIPTSANIVEIKKGKEKVIFHLNDGNYAVQNDIQIDNVKKLSKNGEDVRSLTIFKPLSFLDENVSLMDTPGIDSSDDLEFKRTLDHVHLIDYFVYVMDYNHVQSEVNFNFLSELTKKNVPYMIVVNQIDKHNEREINFDSYKQSLNKSIQSWNLNPEHIYFTSLKVDDHELNQFKLMIKSVQELMFQKEELISKRIQNELSLMIKEHVDDIFESYEDDSASHFKLTSELDHVQQQINELHDEKNSLSQSINNDITKLLNNAYLMDFNTRELAKKYLESRQANFKVGGLFSKKKTAEAKNERLQLFLSTLNERVKTEMVWHVRDLLQQILMEYDLNNESLIHDIQSLQIDLTEKDIEPLTSEQANVTGDYVLVFSNQLQAFIVQHIKSDLNGVLERLVRHIKEVLNVKISNYEQKIIALNEELNEYESVESTLTEKESKQENLFNAVFNSDLVFSKTEEQLRQFNSKYREVNINSLLKNDDIQINDEQSKKAETNTVQIKEIENIATEYVKEIGSIDLLQPFKDAIEKRLEQMNKLQFTVALFGAFSAGKSSFANAWIGEDILPSSPNPTTAAINRILPIDEEHQHRDIVVYFKSEETLLYQLQQLIAPYTDETFNELDSIYKFIKKRNQFLKDVMSQTESSFLQAFLTGYGDLKKSINSKQEANLDELKKYVTVEHISSFVDHIDIYYDCELTRKGVTLVDTPGADSIHSRHTNVAMHYVKHSDLIVYVNYYHHAFSRADREFLIQLGQVKDAFSLNKMLFVLNASDLAKTEDELDLVKNYLEDQLNQYGINEPVIYPLSSKQLMNEPNLKETAYRAFFDHFNSFIEEDAKMVLATGLINEIEQLTSFLEQSIQEAKEDREQQKLVLQTNRDELTNLQTWLNEFNHELYSKQIEQEIEQLTHYLNERMMIQFLDLMKEAINPATIQSNGKRGKEELKIAIKQLIGLLKEKLTMEFQTLEILLNRQLVNTMQTVVRDVNRHIDEKTEFTKMYYDLNEIRSIEQTTIFNQTIDDSKIDEFLVHFKNKKEFFERNKVSELFDELNSTFSNHIEKEVNDFKRLFKNHYEKQFEYEVKLCFEHYVNQVETIIEAKAQLFSNEQLVNHFEEIVQLKKSIIIHK